MKIVTDNEVYVQKNDIAYLNQIDIPIPASIYLKTFGNTGGIINNNNRYDFVKFDDDNEIEFFSKIDWMVDYSSVKDLSEDEIIKMGQNIAQSKNEIAQQFNSMSDDDRKKNLDMVVQCELLDFKMYSLRDFIWFKEGKLKMTLPEGITYPKELVKNDENGIQKIIKKLFPRRK